MIKTIYLAVLFCFKQVSESLRQLHHLFRSIVDRVNIGDLFTFEFNPALLIKVIDSSNYALTISLEVSPKCFEVDLAPNSRLRRTLEDRFNKVTTFALELLADLLFRANELKFVVRKVAVFRLNHSFNFEVNQQCFKRQLANVRFTRKLVKHDFPLIGARRPNVLVFVDLFQYCLDGYVVRCIAKHEVLKCAQAMFVSQ